MLFTEINPRDYRPWYGLGLMYSKNNLQNFALHYFLLAQKLKPTDTRMLFALAQTFDIMGRCYEALVCYYRALLYDNDKTAIVKASGYVKTNNIYTFLHVMYYLQL